MPFAADPARDFGGLIHRTPRTVLSPGSPAELAAGIRTAAAEGVGFAAQGRRHSVFGRGLVADGIVADMTGLRAVGDVTAQRVVVEAGASWREVLAATLPRGLVPAVLPDYLDLSVGGTLAVGGIGAATARHGAATDAVTALEGVTGAGEVASWASGDALFDVVRAGLGQVAVTTRVALALVRAPVTAYRHLLAYRDVAALLADQRRLVGQLADGGLLAVQGAVVAGPDGWTPQLEVVADRDDPAALAGLAGEPEPVEPLPYLTWLDRLAPLERALRAAGQWEQPHPWLTTFLPDRTADELVAGELAWLAPADLGRFGRVVLSPIPRAAVRTPMLRLPDDELCVQFNLVRFPASGAAAAPMPEANRAVYDRVRAAGGTLYPASAFPMSADDWRAHFGPVHETLTAARRRHDPDGVLTPGYEVFRPSVGDAAAAPGRGSGPGAAAGRRR
ncbi:FAD-binding protein [Pseudonocardia sp.]|uniref:FAD-binding protein n=1 Tax=Pseudonocardia sp. TaxID=60912 RepID=UPI003D097FC3